MVCPYGSELGPPETTPETTILSFPHRLQPGQLPRLLVTQANESSSEKPSEIMTGAMRGWEIDR